MSKRLIIAPHADDEALGCGGVIAKYPQECTVVVLSDKNDGRMAEFARAKKVLGYADHIVAPFTTGMLTIDSRTVTSWLDDVIRDQRPDVLYLPTPGVHQDHIATYESGIRAARMSYTGRTCAPPTVLLYDVPSYTTALYPIPYPWSYYEVLTEDQINAKVAAISEYVSQNGGNFNPSEMVLEHAKYLGFRFGEAFIEQYATVREVVK